MSGSFAPNGQLDVSTGLVIACVGKKKSGKSVMALVLARSYPGDVVVIDVAGDDGPTPPHTHASLLDRVVDDPVHELTGTVDELPGAWPEHLREGRRRMILRYVPDPGSPTFLDDIDAVIALAYSHGKCCLLIHEGAIVAPTGQTRPHMRRVLIHNRHRQLTVILCMPRTKGIDTLILGQADLVYAFDLPQKLDRIRLGEIVGWPAEDVDEVIRDLGPHEYARYDANEPKPPDTDPDDDPRFVHFPALPKDVVDDVLRWSTGHRTPRET